MGLQEPTLHAEKKFRIVNEMASQNLFIHQLLIRPTEDELNNYGKEDFTIIAAPGFQCNPELDGTHSEAAIIINFEKKIGIICGSRYSGEIKKMVFCVMNLLMPDLDVLPMHCSANIDPVIRRNCRILWAFRNRKNNAFNRSEQKTYR